MSEVSESIGSVLPMSLVNESGTVVEEIICNSISGGADYKDGMPKRLGLMRFKDGKLVGSAEYILSCDLNRILAALGSENVKDALIKIRNTDERNSTLHN